MAPEHSQSTGGKTGPGGMVKSGENITQAIIHSLEDRLERLKGRRLPSDRAEDLLCIARRCAVLPDQDQRTPEEILGYDDDGAWR